MSTSYVGTLRINVSDLAADIPGFPYLQRWVAQRFFALSPGVQERLAAAAGLADPGPGGTRLVAEEEDDWYEHTFGLRRGRGWAVPTYAENSGWPYACPSSRSPLKVSLYDENNPLFPPVIHLSVEAFTPTRLDKVEQWLELFLRSFVGNGAVVTGSIIGIDLLRDQAVEFTVPEGKSLRRVATKPLDKAYALTLMGDTDDERQEQ